MKPSRTAEFSSEAVTRGIRVRVDPQFDPQRSQPARGRWFFLYTVTIRNESSETVQLLTRHWVITDGTGRVEEVKGPGVVGEQPVLAPGEAFEYTSGCPLSVDVGKMEGSYQMVTEDGDLFDVDIAPFTLCETEVVH
ncbi:MAG: Co2+/Mg2+ efflux protein ApaG [Acidobacteria bacterium]|nr:Co2+/Mg2+ efflux protein ApaG [Acidobacteriota bacterium]